MVEDPDITAPWLMFFQNKKYTLITDGDQPKES